MARQNCQEETEFQEPTLRREQTAKSEDLSGEIQGEPGESQPADTADDAEAQRDFWSIQGDFMFRHHIEPRIQIYVSKEGTIPIPRKDTDVTGATFTNLDMLQERARESKFFRLLERIHGQATT